MSDNYDYLPNQYQGASGDLTFVQHPRVQMFRGRMLAETEHGSALGWDMGANAPHQRRVNVYTGDLWTGQQITPLHRANEAAQNAPGGLASPFGGVI